MSSYIPRKSDLFGWWSSFAPLLPNLRLVTRTWLRLSRNISANYRAFCTSLWLTVIPTILGRGIFLSQNSLVSRFVVYRSLFVYGRHFLAQTKASCRSMCYFLISDTETSHSGTGEAVFLTKRTQLVCGFYQQYSARTEAYCFSFILRFVNV